MKNKILNRNFQLGLLGFLLLFFVAEVLLAGESFDADYLAKIKRPIAPVIRKTPPPPEPDFIPSQSDRVLKYEPGVVLVKWESDSKKSSILGEIRSKFSDLQTKDLFAVSEKTAKSDKQTKLRKKYGLDRIQVLNSNGIKQKVLNVNTEKLRKEKEVQLPQIPEFDRKDFVVSQDRNIKNLIVSQFVVDDVSFMMTGDGEVYDTETLKLLELTPGAELNKLLEPDSDDAYFPRMWDLNERQVNYPVEDLNMDGDFTDNQENAWSVAGSDISIEDLSGGEGVVVAILDSGVDFTHEDLQGKAWVNPGEFSNNHIDDDANGYINDINGYNFTDNNNDISDYLGHGTHIAGTIAASVNNNIGIAGIAPDVKIMALRVLPDAYDDKVVEAIEYAVDNGAKVMNLSFSRSGRSSIVEDAINYAADSNVAIVVSSSNDGYLARKKYPANIKSAITVGASNSVNEKARFSNYGPEIDVVAPGVSILSLLAVNSKHAEEGLNHIYENNYYISSGTSMSVPHVVGAAASIFANNPGFTVEQVNQALRISADDLDKNGFDENTGYGKINLGRALSFDSVPEALWYEPVNYQKINGVFPISGKVWAQDLEVWTIKYKPADNSDAQWQDVWQETGRERQFNQNIDGSLGEFWTTFLPDGEIYLKLEVTDKNGVIASDIIKVEVDNIYFSSPDPDLFHVFGKEDIVFEGHVEGMGRGEYELSYQQESCDIADESCWKRIKKMRIPTSRGLYDGELGVWQYRYSVTGSPFKRKGEYRVRLKGSFYDTYESSDYMTIIVDDDIKEGWPVKVPRYIIYNKNVCTSSSCYALGDELAYQPSLIPTTVGDLDSDGDKEIAVVIKGDSDVLEAYYEGSIFVYDHNGQILPGWPYKFEFEVEDGSATIFYYLDSQDPIFYDLDNDGVKEIFIYTRMYRTRGGPGFQVWAFDIGGNPLDDPRFPIDLFDNNFDSNRETAMTRLVMDDIDGDLSPEFIFYNNIGAFSVVNINGEFLPGWPKYLESDPLRLDEYKVYLSPAIGDLDGDGFKDIIATLDREDENTRYWWQLFAFSGRDGSELWHRESHNDVRVSVSPILADLNKDGKLEVLAGDSLFGRADKYLYVFNGEDGSDFDGWPFSLELNGLIRDICALSVGNLDDDSELEIVINGYDSIMIMDHNGVLKSNGFRTITNNSERSNSLDTPIITDIDGDFSPDILIGSMLYMFAYDGNLNKLLQYQISPLEYAQYTGKFWKSSALTFPKLVDIDKDLLLELVFSNSWTKDGPNGKDYIIVYDLETSISDFFERDEEETGSREEEVGVRDAEIIDHYTDDQSHFDFGEVGDFFDTDDEDDSSDSGSEWEYELPFEHWPMFNHDLQHTNRYEEPSGVLPETEEARGERGARIKGKIKEWRNRIEAVFGGEALPEDFEEIFDGGSLKALESRLREIMSSDGSLSENEQILIDEVIGEAVEVGLFEMTTER